MIKIFNKVINLIYCSWLRITGASIGGSSSVHYSLSVTNPQNISIGQQTIIYKMCSIYLGKNGHFSMDGGSHVAPFGYLLIDNNEIRIGSKVAIGPFCCMICHSNHYTAGPNGFSDTYIDGDILIGSNVFIGAQVTLLPNTIIEDNVVVGANSVVKGRLESGWVYAGSPARKIKVI